MPRLYWLFCLLLSHFTPERVCAQSREENQATYQLRIERARGTIRIDGVLDEGDWEQADVADNFWLKWPRYGEPAPTRTSVRLTYDGQFLYVGAVCYDSTPQFIIQNLKRDAGYWESDGLAVILDPANRASNGYFFGLNAAGAQTEGLVTTDSNNDDFTWDNRWYGAVHVYADRWTAEYAIPFQILRFSSSVTTWGINFIRNDASNGQWNTWTKVPMQMEGTDLGFTGALLWDKAPAAANANYNFSPFVTGGLAQESVGDNRIAKQADAGLDAKIGIGSALNVDLTINPDFSQIEIDEQVINLTRFNVQLPEKRTFFLENADLFGNFGIPPIRPFFSRRIGLDGQGQPIPILAGLRLTGNINPTTRIGILSMQTAARDGLPSHNYSALTFNKRLLSRSGVSGYFHNRQGFDGADLLGGNYGRNFGLELGHTTDDGKWSLWSALHGASRPGVKKHRFWGFQYNAKKFDILLDFLSMGANYIPEMGFEARIENFDIVRDTVIRLGYNFIFSEANYRFLPKDNKGGRLNLSELSATNFSVINPDGTLNEQFNELKLRLFFRNTSFLRFSLSNTLARVPVAFRFGSGSLTDCPALNAGQYQFGTFGIGADSDRRKALSLETDFSAGTFYRGTQYSAMVGMRLRLQPWGNLGLGFQYNLLDLPQPYCDLSLFNITPRIEIFFNRNFNWTTFIQYNTQADNFNINSRIQWRFRPMSDLFLVYTDNYAVRIWGSKNRSMVLKVNYWL
jgi:hypothetical protein